MIPSAESHTWFQRFVAVLRDTSESRKWMFYAKIAIAVGLLTYLVLKLGSVELWSVFTGADPWLLAGVLGLLVVNIFLQYLKWEQLCTTSLDEHNKKEIFLSLSYGLAAGAFTPVRLGEYVARRLPFHKKGLLEVTLATAVDKLFTMFITSFIGGLAAVLFLRVYMDITPFLTVSLFLLLFGMMWLFTYLALSEDFWQGVVYKRLARIRFLAPYIDRIRVIRLVDSKTLAKQLLFSFLLYLVFITQYALLVSAFSEEIHFLPFMWLGSLMFFAKTIIPSISISDLGVREAASVYFAISFGYSELIGFNAAFLLFCFNILLPAALGGLLLLKRDK